MPDSQTPEPDNNEDLDPRTRGVIAAIGDAGFVVSVRWTRNGFIAMAESKAGRRVAVAGGDPYATVCDLARTIGVDLEDG